MHLVSSCSTSSTLVFESWSLFCRVPATAYKKTKTFFPARICNLIMNTFIENIWTYCRCDYILSLGIIWKGAHGPEPQVSFNHCYQFVSFLCMNMYLNGSWIWDVLSVFKADHSHSDVIEYTLDSYWFPNHNLIALIIIVFLSNLESCWGVSIGYIW